MSDRDSTSGVIEVLKSLPWVLSFSPQPTDVRVEDLHSSLRLMTKWGCEHLADPDLRDRVRTGILLYLMGSYDAQQVCENGHQITASYNRHPEFRQDACDKCGAKTIHQCPTCATPIKGYYSPDGGLRPPPVPDYCHKCTHPYPWTQRAAKRAELATTARKESSLEAVLELLERFDLLVRHLRKRFDARPTLDVADEYDVQDLLRSLFCLYFDGVYLEDPTPQGPGGHSRIDFTIREIALALEIKYLGPNLSERELVDQIHKATARYDSRKDWSTLLFFVYDPERRLLSARAIEKDLTRESQGRRIRVFISPK